MAKHILIIGSPGSGKSVFGAALASAAGKRKKQTLLISGDSRISMLSFFCGNTDADGLGTLYAGEITSQRCRLSFVIRTMFRHSLVHFPKSVIGPVTEMSTEIVPLR